LKDTLSMTANLRITAETRWIWSQHWMNLLFLHWRVAVDAVVPHVPAGVEIETADGWAWVGLVLFRLRVRPRWLPFVPGISTLNELNLRTYVRYQDKPGISFLSIHADNRWAICLARRFTPLPYFQARIRYEESAAGLSFECCNLAVPNCRLGLEFRPKGAVRPTQDGTVDAWLLERYRLFIAGKCAHLQEAEVAHPRWHYRDAQVAISTNTIGSPFALDLSRQPDRVHFSPSVRTRFGAFRPVSARQQRCQELNAPAPTTDFARLRSGW